MTTFYLPARAKLNLTLRIVGRRDDGYHLLETLYHAIELHDDVWLQRQERGIGLEVCAESERSAAPAGPDNLAVRALGLLCREAGVESGFRLRLHKRIPTGGGLGGGSSNAAAALRLGNLALGEPLSPAALAALAAQLGADVPFFLDGGSQWGKGIGDQLSAAVVGPLWFVLILPPFGCATGEVYKNYAAHWIDGRPQDSVEDAPSVTTRERALRMGYCNDLQQAAEAVRPALGHLRQQAADLGKVSVHLTGSGSTLFVGCDNPAAARRCVDDLGPLAAERVVVVETRSAVARDLPERVSWPAQPGPRPARWQS